MRAIRLCVAGGGLLASAALACIHPPIAYQGAVSERLKEAFMFHDGQLAHLVLRTSLRAQGALPESMAWVIPLPSLPKVMEEADEHLFADLFSLTSRPAPPQPQARPAAKGELKATAAAAPAIRVHAVTVAGNYRLQPIEILSELAGAELNAWLAANGFGSVPAENQRFYLKKGAVFLAVRADALKGKEVELKPLHLAYPADNPALPLKFSSHSGVFDVLLYTLTPEKPPQDSLKAFHLEMIHSVEVRGADLALRASGVHKLIGSRAGWLSRFRGTDFNSAGRFVTELGTDPAFGAPAPVTRTTISSETRDIALRVLVFAGLAGAIVFLTLRRRRNRQLPWRLRSAVYVALVGVAYFGWFQLAQAYSDYITRSKVSMSMLAAARVKGDIGEKAVAAKSLKGAGEGVAAPDGVAVSRDGVISYSLDPAEVGMRLKFILTPVMQGEEVAWSCEALPLEGARRLAPQGCVPE